MIEKLLAANLLLCLAVGLFCGSKAHYKQRQGYYAKPLEATAEGAALAAAASAVVWVVAVSVIILLN